MAAMNALHLRTPCASSLSLFPFAPSTPSPRRSGGSPPSSLGAPGRCRRTGRVPLRRAGRLLQVRACDDAAEGPPLQGDEEVQDLGVRVALSMLRFYKRQISPLLPSSCRYVPSCSEYSMQAYKKYGVAKGTILTAWRLCRCNPLGVMDQHEAVSLSQGGNMVSCPMSNVLGFP